MKVFNTLKSLNRKLKVFNNILNTFIDITYTI